MRPPRGGKLDGNHKDVVDALRDYGCNVKSLAGVGTGLLDLLCGLHGRLFLVETKVPGGTLTPAQVEFIEEWKAFPLFVVESAAEAIEVAKRIERRNRENT